MKKNFKWLVALLIVMMLVGCFGNNNEVDENGAVDNDTIVEEESGGSISDVEERPGLDPLYPKRYPGSVRTNHVVNSFSIYVAEATIDDVLAFYQDEAAKRDYDFSHEVLPENHPHWVAVTGEEDNLGFSFTLGESDVCENCVEFVLYAFEWPDN